MSHILLTSAGRRVSLLRFFKREASRVLGNKAPVSTTDCKPEWAPACILADAAFQTGNFHSATYVDELLTLCREQQVSLVVPLIDPELELMARARPQFLSSKINVVVSEAGFVQTCRDKRRTFSFFRDRGIDVPELFDPHSPQFPLFIKPRFGSNSQQTFLIESPEMMPPALQDGENWMLMPYLRPEEWQEYTVDAYYSDDGYLRCAVPRLRVQVRGGEVVKSHTVRNGLYQLMWEKLSHIEGARGVLTLQFFVHKESGQILGSEINARFGGGYPLSYLAGANYPAWLMKEYLLGEKPEVFEEWKTGMRMLRYDQELVVEPS